MRIAVTGASGFIGRSLIPRLQGRHEIVPLGREWTEPEPARRLLKGTDALIHLAGIKGRDRCEQNAREAVAVNVAATRRLVETARESGVSRFLFASTYGVYGRRDRGDPPSPEDQDLNPEDLYGLTKAWAEGIVRKGFPAATVLRLGHVYGQDPKDAHPDVIPLFWRSALEEGVLRVRGSGQTRIDPIWIGDACECIRRLLERAEGGVFNVASGRSLTILELAEAIRDHVKGLGIPARVVREGAEDPSEFDRVPDVRRLLKTLSGFAPRAFAEGLQEFSMEKRDDLLVR